MKKGNIVFIVSILLLTLSISPLFIIIREFWVDYKITERYEIHHAYEDDQGFKNIVDVQELMINDTNIKIVEESTGKKAPLDLWDKDENVLAGDIVKIHLLVNDQDVSQAHEIWLSNRDRGSRYFSWLDIMTVHNRDTGQQQIAIVQRLTDNNYPMESRKWKIITISQDGNVQEETLNYSERKDNHLGVKLIRFSGTQLMFMGYYSDIIGGYPSLIFPILYPVVTGMAGVILFIVSIVLFYRRKLAKDK